MDNLFYLYSEYGRFSYSQKHISLIYVFLFLSTFKCDASEVIEPPRIGNFALSPSQQPGPFIAFGENIISKNETQLYLLEDDYVGSNKQFIDLVPSILYGITDKFSIYFNVPLSVSYKQDKDYSNGFEDIFVQLEHAFYDKETYSFTEQFTVVGNVTFPSGSSSKIPPTGSGAPTFFVGTTYNRTYVDWFFFGSPGALFPTAHDDTRFGNAYFYQLGLGRNIADRKGWIFAWMVEGDGTYTERSIMNGVIDPNTGGNIIYVTPSLWASTEKLILQFGVGLPVVQNLYGNQPRNSYLIAANLGWSLYPRKSS